jgi:hypothetical protein
LNVRVPTNIKEEALEGVSMIHEEALAFAVSEAPLQRTLEEEHLVDASPALANIQLPL